MYSKLLIGLFFLQLLWSVKSETDKACKEALSGLMKRQVKLISDCAKDLKFKNSEDKIRRGSCLMKCVMKRGGVLNDKGLPDNEASDKLIKSTFAENIWEKAAKLLAKCEEFAQKIDPEEDTCKTYDPMIKCGAQAFNKFCI